VLDSGRFVAGPWAATHLGEFGAEVIHVEGPPFRRPYADPTRSLPPLIPAGAPRERQVSESWVQYSRNKLSVGLDPALPEGRELFLRLLEHCDIWVESSRPGTYTKLGLDDERVLARCPRLTVVHVSGYGQTGDAGRIGRPSFDLLAQAYSGYLSLQGEPEPSAPMRAGTALNDTVTGLAAAGAALMGYISSVRTGKGQVVDVAQYEVFFSLLENLALDFFARGLVRGRAGRAHPRLHPYDVVQARDGWVVVAAPNPSSWLRLKEMVGLPTGLWDEMEWRLAHREEVEARLWPFFASRTVAELESLARQHDAAVSGIPTIDRLADDPHYRAREMFLDWEDPVAGPVRGAGIAPKFLSTPGRVWRGAPWLGQDNARVLGGLLGVPDETLTQLELRGAIGAEPPPEDKPAESPSAPGGRA
jgi:crotonobetainyl-CoA:carnitine CoA-transferase CaiB-like acyl-CoA transferase